MTKTSNQIASITPAAVAQALAAGDDFGHEMRVRAALKRVARVQHGWAYLDPVEGKPRQFDFRARLEHPHMARQIHLAVECKNLAGEAPLVVSGTAREKDEAFHHYVAAEEENGRGRGVFKVWRDQDIYSQGKFVGKSIVRLKTDKGTLVTGPDVEIYKGWTQALASADELCKEAITAKDHMHRQVFTVVLPLVVVPDNTLWTAEYKQDGTPAASPTLSESTTLFLNHEIVIVPHNHWIRLGHVHFLTLRGLEDFLTGLTSGHTTWEEWFPPSAEHYTPPVH